MGKNLTSLIPGGKITFQRYLDENGYICPNCQKRGIYTTDMNSKSPALFYYTKECPECGCAWTEERTISNVTVDIPSKPD